MQHESKNSARPWRLTKLNSKIYENSSSSPRTQPRVLNPSLILLSKTSRLPFEKEVKEKNLLIGKLRHEAVILNDHLTKALKYIKRSKPDDTVDKYVSPVPSLSLSLTRYPLLATAD
jgi:hypothetical protein